MERKRELRVREASILKGKAWLVLGVCKRCGFFHSSAPLLITYTPSFRNYNIPNEANSPSTTHRSVAPSLLDLKNDF